jgi:hypothetical protein
MHRVFIRNRRLFYFDLLNMFVPFGHGHDGVYMASKL